MNFISEWFVVRVIEKVYMAEEGYRGRKVKLPPKFQCFLWSCAYILDKIKHWMWRSLDTHNLFHKNSVKAEQATRSRMGLDPHCLILSLFIWLNLYAWTKGHRFRYDGRIYTFFHNIPHSTSLTTMSFSSKHFLYCLHIKEESDCEKGGRGR